MVSAVRCERTNGGPIPLTYPMKSLDVINLTRQLVAIPSFVDNNSDEVQIGNFLVEFAQKRLVGIPVNKQYLSKDSQRSNVYIGNPNPEVLFIGHIDTVQPQPGWSFDPLMGAVQKERVYGLGSSDMKGSIAAFLCALIKVKNNINSNKLGVLLYCDEEYDFLGMKAYIQTPKKSPKIIISLDGKLQLSSGCRGLIEISGSTRGKSSHSSKPFSGTNAILKTVEAFRIVDQSLSTFFDPILGTTTTNLAYLNGGSLQGNIIPGVADFIFEVRTSSPKINAGMIIKQLKTLCKNLGVTFTNLKTRHNLPPWPPAYNSQYSKIIAEILKNSGLNSNLMSRDFSGYIDIAMLESVYPNVPKFVYGAGGDAQHCPDEYVPIENLKSAQKVYEQILLKFIKK